MDATSTGSEKVLFLDKRVSGMRTAEEGVGRRKGRGELDREDGRVAERVIERNGRVRKGSGVRSGWRRGYQRQNGIDMFFFFVCGGAFLKDVRHDCALVMRC